MSIAKIENQPTLSLEEKRALIAQLFEEKNRKPKQAPLSFAQERLWFLDQLEPGNVAYNIAEAVRLTGQLDVAALRNSLCEIVRRHETLRTIFAATDGYPFQLVAPPTPLPLALIDLQHFPKVEREKEAWRLVSIEAHRPFNLAKGPLFRASLLRLQEKEHILVLTMHHIIFDGWSMRVLVQEFAALYKAFSAGMPSPLSDLPVQYRDFAAWQRRWLRGDELDRQLAYWREQLRGMPEVLELPADHPRPPIPTFRGAQQPFALSRPLTERLRQLARQERATLFMVLLAAFETLLHRYTGRTDIVVGSPIANRSRAEVEGLIGFFVNILVMRADLSGNPTFRGLLKQVSEMTLAAYAHQDLPFEILVERLRPERDASRAPLVQVILALQNAPVESLELPALTLKPLESLDTVSRLDIEFLLRDLPDGLSGYMLYNTGIFEPDTIARLLKHYEILLTDIVADPDRRLADLAILTGDEQQQVVIEWNSTETEYPRDKCIQELFEAQVALAPDAVAVIFDQEDTGPSEHFTYSEVNRRANRMAHLLRRLNTVPGKLVGVWMDRSPEMIVGLLGILKAGGTYVPLDPCWPDERIGWILSSLQAPCILVDRLRQSCVAELGKSLPDLQDVICPFMTSPDNAQTLDGPESHLEKRLWTDEHLNQLPDIDVPPLTTPDDIAYIIHTSGSTGVPKGVVVSHRPVVNLITWVNNTFQVGPHDRELFTTSLCFDLSVYDIFGLLAAGGAIWVPPESYIRDAERLLHLLCHRPVTFWDSAPAALQQLVPFFSSLQSGRGVDRLRLVFLSGDWIPLTLPDAVRKIFPHAQVIGLGGATEATIWSNYYPVGEIDPLWTSIPYGKPIQNAQYFVLDAHLRPCPVGVPGDLYIGGECLALGYANQPTVTAEKFIPDPFSFSRKGKAREGARLYKTGDLARYFPDGNIEFLGRVDHQVKVRGYRIELGEIESVLAQHPAVRQALVLVRGDPFDDKRLVAYVVPEQQRTDDNSLGQAVSSQDPANNPLQAEFHRELMIRLRCYLQEKLPDYMVPAAFVMLDALPLTPNGKVDRHALPEPEATRPELEVAFVAPRTAVEEQLARIWSEVLGLEKVGVQDDFFALGGHSLLATQVVSRIRNIFQIEFPLRSFFESPTIASLAETIAQGEKKQQEIRELEALLSQIENLSRAEAEAAIFSEARSGQRE